MFFVVGPGPQKKKLLLQVVVWSYISATAGPFLKIVGGVNKKKNNKQTHTTQLSIAFGSATRASQNTNNMYNSGWLEETT